MDSSVSNFSVEPFMHYLPQTWARKRSEFWRCSELIFHAKCCMWFNEDARGSLDSVISPDVESFMHSYPASAVITLFVYVTGGFCQIYRFVLSRQAWMHWVKRQLTCVVATSHVCYQAVTLAKTAQVNLSMLPSETPMLLLTIALCRDPPTLDG